MLFTCCYSASVDDAFEWSVSVLLGCNLSSVIERNFALEFLSKQSFYFLIKKSLAFVVEFSKCSSSKSISSLRAPFPTLLIPHCPRNGLPVLRSKSRPERNRIQSIK